MAVKTFTTGEVLTAADTNTYLNNGGLVYITQASVTAGATVTISNCFTATYDSYRAHLVTTAFSTNPNLYFQFTKSGTPTGANYFWSAWYTTNAGASGISAASSGTSVSPAYCSSALPQGFQIVEINGVFATRNTTYTFEDNHNDTAGQVIRNGGGIHTDATSHDGIRFGVGAGTMTATLFIYGYRQA